MPPHSTPAIAISDLLDKQAVVKRIGGSVRTLEKLIKERSFPPGVRLGQTLYWTREVADKWLARKFHEQGIWHT